MSSEEIPEQAQTIGPHVSPDVQDPASTTNPTSARLSPRSGPIVAGTLVLVLCAYVVVQTMGGSVDTTTWIIGTILGLGVLLLLVGIAVLTRGSRSDGR